MKSTVVIVEFAAIVSALQYEQTHNAWKLQKKINCI